MRSKSNSVVPGLPESPSCDNPHFCLSFRLRCKPHPGPREGLNPLVFEKKSTRTFMQPALRTFGK